MSNFLKPVRRNPGLGDPPKLYFNNLPESAYAVVKRDMDSKPSRMSHLGLKMEVLVNSKGAAARKLSWIKVHTCLQINFKPWKSLHKSGFKWISHSENQPCKSSARLNFRWYTVMMPQYPSTQHLGEKQGYFHGGHLNIPKATSFFGGGSQLF